MNTLPYSKVIFGMFVLLICFTVGMSPAHAYGGRYDIPVEADGVMLMDDLIARIRLDDDVTKAQRVNRFFNQILLRHSYGSPRTPQEVVMSGFGNQQEIAIAKFFALEAAGIASHRMSVARARHRELNDTLYVLLVYPGESSEPLVLDTMTRQMQWLSDRRGLLVIDTMSRRELDPVLNTGQERPRW
jgi:predicted transglutaminase-like cysteine proteinase